MNLLREIIEAVWRLILSPGASSENLLLTLKPKDEKHRLVVYMAKVPVEYSVELQNVIETAAANEISRRIGKQPRISDIRITELGKREGL